MDPALEDLREVVTVGLARGGELLTAGEHAVARRILALDGAAGALYARLSARVPEVFRDDFDPGAVTALIGADLADRLVPWRARAEHLPVAELAGACRALGLPRTGRKADLVARLAPHAGWHPTRWLRIRHKALVRRLERWAFLDAFPDRSRLVVARLGVVRWPEYALTTGAGLHRDRRALLAWEALRGGVAPEAALDALAAGAGRAAGGLDLERALRRGVREAAHALERDEPQRAAALYGGLAASGERPARIAFRRARAEERCGRPAEALAILREALPSARPSEALGIARAGRRLARALRTSFAPPRPLAPPRTRDLRLLPAPATARPAWDTPDGPRPVEAAVVSLLAGQGRVALHGEGEPWRTLAALLLADLYFLPVPGALPVRFLAGPLDLGTPGFRAARAAAVDDLLREIEAGGAPERVRAADARWRGTRLAGARWDLDPDLLLALASAIPGPALRRVVEVWMEHGHRGVAGLPDLAILPGPEVGLPGAHPSRLPPGLVLAEVKGPGDQLRDEQHAWLDRLAAGGARAELWHVTPAG